MDYPDFNFEQARLLANMIGGSDISDEKVKKLMEEAVWCADHDNIIRTLYMKFLQETNTSHSVLTFALFAHSIYEKRNEVIFQESEDGRGFYIVKMSKN